MRPRKYSIGGEEFELPNLDGDLQEEFVKIHQALSEWKKYDTTKLGNLAHTFFNSNLDCKMHDRFFNCFTLTWYDCWRRKREGEAIALWNFALKIAENWEQVNQPKKIHKGTPYYFLGGTYIYLGNYLKGFFLMHQAFEEDRKHKEKPLEAPAGCFVTLNSEKAEQYFKSYVDKMAHYLGDKIRSYYERTGGNLSIGLFCKRFLMNPKYSEQVFLFVYSLWNIRRMQQKDMELYQSIFGSILRAEMMFALCVIFDEIVADNDGKKYTSEHIETCCIKHLEKKDFRGKIGDLNREKKEGKSGFESILEAVIDKKFKFTDGNAPSQIEWDFALLYLMRNFAAHSVKSYGAVSKRFDEIVQSLLDCIFFAVENVLS